MIMDNDQTSAGQATAFEDPAGQSGAATGATGYPSDPQTVSGDLSGPKRRCPRCGETRPLHPRWAVCHPCAADCGWDPHCEACRVEDAGLPLGDLEHGTACLDGRIARRATVTVLTKAQAAELTRRRETLSLECGASSVPRCAGCDGAAMDGGGPCQHDCHTPGVVDLSDLVERRTGRSVAGAAYERGIFDAGRAAGRREAFEHELAQSEGCAAALDLLPGQQQVAWFYRQHAEHVRAVLAQERQSGDIT